MERRISQGQAIRSTLASSRVTHSIFGPPSSLEAGRRSGRPEPVTRRGIVLAPILGRALTLGLHPISRVARSPPITTGRGPEGTRPLPTAPTGGGADEASIRGRAGGAGGGSPGGSGVRR